MGVRFSLSRQGVWERKLRHLSEAVVGKTITDVYLDGNYMVFKLSDGSAFQVHYEYLFDKDGYYFNLDKVDYRY